MKGMLAICNPLTEYNRRKIEGLTEGLTELIADTHCLTVFIRQLAIAN